MAVVMGVGTFVPEARRGVRQTIDPARMQALLELSNGAEELAGNERHTVMDEKVYLGEFERKFGVAVFIDRDLGFRFQEKQIAVLEIKGRIERRGEECTAGWGFAVRD